jgi:hypothetical protein
MSVSETTVGWATPGRRALLAVLVALIVTAATSGHHEFGNNYVYSPRRSSTGRSR